MQRSYTAGVVSLLLLLQLLSIKSKAQSPTSLSPGYYIVVAAYRLNQDTYAQNYVTRITRRGVDAKYGADLGRKYLYVYLDYFTDFDESIKQMLATRKKDGFEQAWVRIMKDSVNTNMNLLTQKKEPESEPVAPTSNVESKPAPIQAAAKKENPSVVEVPKLEAGEESDMVEPPVEEEPTNVEGPITEPKPVAESSVFLSLFIATNNEPVEGEVEVVDADRARLINKINGNEYLNLPDPKSKSGKLTLIANVFGYRPIQHEILYGQVPDDSTSHFMEWAGNHYIIKFDLVRYHKGDIQTLYNVYFYNDAAIMLPESKYQLNNLLTMMKGNPNYRIRLHGHTNGNARGRLITMGPSKTFFSLGDDVKDGSGSAKELSRQRAQVIKDWLVSEGIAEERIEIKAWGGSRMIFDKNSANAKKNVRVDVEILQE